VSSESVERIKPGTVSVAVRLLYVIAVLFVAYDIGLLVNQSAATAQNLIVNPGAGWTQAAEFSAVTLGSALVLALAARRLDRGSRRARTVVFVTSVLLTLVCCLRVNALHSATVAQLNATADPIPWLTTVRNWIEVACVVLFFAEIVLLALPRSADYYPRNDD
jgi:uncharacterized membrane protein YkvI